MQAVLHISDLPDGALDAAADFHARYLPEARAALDGKAQELALVFPAAGHDHAGWREAAVADLARMAVPKRVNGVSGGDEAALGETLAWLAAAPGITGQLLRVDGTGAGNPAQ